MSRTQERLRKLEAYSGKSDEGHLPLCFEWPDDKEGQERAWEKIRKATRQGKKCWLRQSGDADLPEGFPDYGDFANQFV